MRSLQVGKEAAPARDAIIGLSEAARGILDTSLATSIPVVFGVLTCETFDQALERSGSQTGNKGAEAAEVALEMAAVKSAIASQGAD